jgi:hypothetical protein
LQLKASCVEGGAFWLLHRGSARSRIRRSKRTAALFQPKLDFSSGHDSDSRLSAQFVERISGRYLGEPLRPLSDRPAADRRTLSAEENL